MLTCALVACYRPAFEGPCQFSCTSDVQCPSDQTCGGNGICHLRDSAECTMLIDAQVPMSDSSDASNCFGHTFFSFCLGSPADGPIDLVTGTLDTDQDTRCRTAPQQQGTDLCVIAAKTIAVSGHVTAIGSKPLVLLGVDSIWVTGSGTIDVSSGWQQTRVAAGSTTGPCMTAALPSDDVMAMNGAGGGPGGSYVSSGGAGGNGLSTDGSGPATIVGAPHAIRGGCPGTRGAKMGTYGPGLGGQAGGAVFLMSAGPITVDGKINASGGGGSIANLGAGGGGGGTGGFIGFDGALSALGSGAQIFAIGGGGSCGGGVPGGVAGQEATGPSSTSTTSCSNSGGDGGIGAIFVGGPGANATNTPGGGGGGGGAGGFIGTSGPITFPALSRVQPPAQPL